MKKKTFKQKQALVITLCFSISVVALILSAISWINSQSPDVASLFLALAYILIGVGFATLFYNHQFNRSILISTLLAIFVSPILIYEIALLIRLFDVGYLSHVADSSVWIGFAGSIIGGSITMLALFYTLNHGENERKRDKQIAIMPIVIIEPDLQENKYLKSTDLSIVNITPNIAKDPEVVKIETALASFIEEYPRHHFRDEIYGHDESNSVTISSPFPGNGRSLLNYKVPMDIGDYPKGNILNIVIRYKDILDLATYYTSFYMVMTHEESLPITVRSYNNTSFEEGSIEYYESGIGDPKELAGKN